MHNSYGTNFNAYYNPFRYRGYYYDTETGLYYLQSRYYNPQWGRFLNADGYVNANGDMIGFNMYAYCSNNPIMYTDPTGNVPIGSVVALAAVSGLCISALGYVIVQNIRSQDDSSHLEKASDINLSYVKTEETKAIYNFDYNSNTYTAIYSTDSAEWHINNSYQIENHDDIVLICSELIQEKPVPGIAEGTHRTASDLTYEWEQHNIAYYYLEPFNIPVKNSVANVDLNRDDQGKSWLQLAWDRVMN